MLSLFFTLSQAFFVLLLFPPFFPFTVQRTTDQLMEERFVSRRTRGLREAVAFFHLVAMVAGLAILSLGAYTINSSFSRTLSVALLAVGGVIAIISFIAYFGAHIEHAGFLKTYSSTTALLLILEIVLVALVYAHRKELDVYGSKAWDFFKANDVSLLGDIEDTLHCCGYNSPQDRIVNSDTCPKLLPDDSIGGCKLAALASFNEWRDWVLAGALIIVGLEVCGAVAQKGAYTSFNLSLSLSLAHSAAHSSCADDHGGA
ncbi:Tetraspanin family-domain-containing protein [Fennellomyces sp. T-0311]|nr:Tetraspanin family-domain-containing protein [Fennellomyces sp. T-0311]